MQQVLGSLMEQFAGEFPQMPRETVLRQLQDAADSVSMFGFDTDDAPALVERLARAHLEALAEISGSGRPPADAAAAEPAG
jgi:hypothetical protein